MEDALRQNLAIGREQFRRGEYAAAEEHLRSALKVRDDVADLHHMLGVIHYDRMEFAEARACLERALALDPAFTDAALALAITLQEIGLYGEARRVSEGIGKRAHGKDRIDPYARGKLANLHAEVARAYEELGLGPEATEEYERALALCPEFPDLRARLASLLRRDGDLERALRELDTAVAFHPDHVPVHLSRGVTLLALGRRDEAAAAWSRALVLEPGHRAATSYLRMLDEGATHVPSMLPPPSVALPTEDETRGMTEDGETIVVQLLRGRAED